MRLMGKPIQEGNGYPWLGTVILLKDASIITMKNGKKQFRAFGTCEHVERGKDCSMCTVSMTTGKNGDLASKLLAWPKKTVLFVAGAMTKSDFWTQKNGKASYELILEFVGIQLDYAAAAKAEQESEARVGENEYGDSYDAGF